ncbi:glycosyltransferase [Caldichromatium japonicum]|uniref:Glycosyltransferase n=1 Tax=Caldichromatium japonicum TaxID=2699430 RepID=A0A6G7VGJ0_9GAMM|nr:glycosyltransferase [Caldichromatium japonicum]QIK38907.1 glycosyltransferase [Caldichromatium japonicum]
MKVLLLTHGGPLDPGRIASGNSVRALGLALGLIEAGHRVIQVYPAALGEPSGPWLKRGLRARTYADPAELAAILKGESPDVLLVGYWELIEALPAELEIPIVLDVVAPRVLEAMYQGHLDLGSEIRRTLACYRRAERFLVGNRRQMSFLLPWLILAGFDCRAAAPIDVVPISAGFETHSPLRLRPGEPIRLVTGGVAWPWRRSENWLAALSQAINQHGPGRAEIVVFSGRYVYEAVGQGMDGVHDARPRGDAAGPAGKVHSTSPLLPYGELHRYLAERCHIGLELADENPERWHSQSFRALECLSLGLPLICNRYLELAELVHAYDAGWTVEGIDELPRLIAEILADPAQIEQKSINALRLLDECFHYRRTIAPVLGFLQGPRQAVRTEPIDLTPVQALPADEIALTPDPSPTKKGEMAAATPAADRKPALHAFRAFKPLILSLTRTIGRLTKGRRPTVILISRADIWPLNHGAAVKIERTAWGLSHAVDRVYLISDDRTCYHEVRQGHFAKRRYPAWLQRLGPDPQRIRTWVLAQGIPEGDAFLYDPAVDWGLVLRTLYVALRSGARCYQAEFPAYARAACWTRDLLSGKALLVEHNVEYQRLADQYPELSPHAQAMLRKIELGWCQRADHVVVVSEHDRAQLIADGIPPERLHLIPHGVDLDSFAQAEPLDLRTLYDIPADTWVLVYHGIYGYPPNLEAMQLMAQEILPRLERLGVRVQVLAIGAHPPGERLHPRLRFIGPVERVAPYLKGADLAVVPLQKGSGTRMKILDYFAAGLPVVSTAKGTEGIPLRPGVEAVIADDPDAFALAIADLLADPARRAQLGTAARAFVEPLDWRAIARRYLGLFSAT